MLAFCHVFAVSIKKNMESKMMNFVAIALDDIHVHDTERMVYEPLIHYFIYGFQVHKIKVEKLQYTPTVW
jgi:hypothetical protein